MIALVRREYEFSNVAYEQRIPSLNFLSLSYTYTMSSVEHSRMENPDRRRRARYRHCWISKRILRKETDITQRCICCGWDP